MDEDSSVRSKSIDGIYNKFIMNYNQFNYYRANPYYEHGSIPPIAHKNRKRPEFMVEMPQGEKHIDYVGRKHYQGGFQQSNIKNEHLLESPERFPYENRIALDKQYERNLNTVDIEGASSNTLMSPAVRNKWRAREAIIRKQQELHQSLDIERGQSTDFERRRSIAMKQHTKNQEMSKLISRKAYKVDPIINDQEKSQAKRHQESIFRNSNEPHQKQFHESKRSNGNAEVQRYSPRQERQIPRYQSIDVSKVREEQPRYQPPPYHHEHIHSMSNYQQPPPRQQQYAQEMVQKPQINMYEVPQRQKANYHNYHSKVENEHGYKIPADRKQFRMQNPTYLSNDSSIVLAGKNLLK